MAPAPRLVGSCLGFAVYVRFLFSVQEPRRLTKVTRASESLREDLGFSAGRGQVCRSCPPPPVGPRLETSLPRGLPGCPPSAPGPFAPSPVWEKHQPEVVGVVQQFPLKGLLGRGCRLPGVCREVCVDGKLSLVIQSPHGGESFPFAPGSVSDSL